MSTSMDDQFLVLLELVTDLVENLRELSFINNPDVEREIQKLADTWHSIDLKISMIDKTPASVKAIMNMCQRRITSLQQFVKFYKDADRIVKLLSPVRRTSKWSASRVDMLGAIYSSCRSILSQIPNTDLTVVSDLVDQLIRHTFNNERHLSSILDALPAHDRLYENKLPISIEAEDKDTDVSEEFAPGKISLTVDGAPIRLNAKNNDQNEHSSETYWAIVEFYKVAKNSPKSVDVDLYQQEHWRTRSFVHLTNYERRWNQQQKDLSVNYYSALLCTDYALIPRSLPTSNIYFPKSVSLKVNELGLLDSLDKRLRSNPNLKTLQSDMDRHMGITRFALAEAVLWCRPPGPDFSEYHNDTINLLRIRPLDVSGTATQGSIISDKYRLYLPIEVHVEDGYQHVAQQTLNRFLFESYKKSVPFQQAFKATIDMYIQGQQVIAQMRRAVLDEFSDDLIPDII